MGSRVEKPSFFSGAAVIALVLFTLSGVRTDFHNGLPCPCDGPNCAPLTECRRLLAESADGDVRYAECHAGRKECCCQNSRTFTKPGVDKTEANFSDKSAATNPPDNYVDTTDTPKTNPEGNKTINNFSDKFSTKSTPDYNVDTEETPKPSTVKNKTHSYIKETSDKFEPNFSEENPFQNGYATTEYNQTGETLESDAWESATFPPALDTRPEATHLHTSATPGPAGNLRIVGGSYDPLRNDNWTVHITSYDYAERSYYQCAGSLVSLRHVLTAAHCQYDKLGNLRLLVRLSFGLREKNRNRPQFVQENDLTFIAHPNFNWVLPSSMNDIALIRTSRPVPMGGIIKAIKLLPATYTTSDLINTWVRVTGWGGTYPASASDLLLQTDMQIVGKFCAQNPAFFNSQSQLCLVGVNRSDICDGDSGAPLTIYLQGKVYLVGVISSGSLDCSGYRPAVAVFAGYHRAWIESTIAQVEPNYSNYVQFI